MHEPGLDLKFTKRALITKGGSKKSLNIMVAVILHAGITGNL
jgi:hypothetical protein